MIAALFEGIWWVQVRFETSKERYISCIVSRISTLRLGILVHMLLGFSFEVFPYSTVCSIKFTEQELGNGVT